MGSQHVALSSDVNKDLGFKAKDLGFKAKDLSFKANDLSFKAKALTFYQGHGHKHWSFRTSKTKI